MREPVTPTKGSTAESNASLSAGNVAAERTSGSRHSGPLARGLEAHGRWLVGAPRGKKFKPNGRFDLREIDLREVNLSMADLNSADLEGADLSGALLNGAALRGGYLRYADFSRANLVESDLTHANLYRVKMVGTDLSRAKLSEAFLAEADLTGANLSGADLTGTSLRHCDLSRADLSGANFDRTLCSVDTVWPSGEWPENYEAVPYRDSSLIFVLRRRGIETPAGVSLFTSVLR